MGNRPIASREYGLLRPRRAHRPPARRETTNGHQRKRPGLLKSRIEVIIHAECYVMGAVLRTSRGG